MKAIVCERYGAPEVLQFKEVEKPTPKDNEVLIRIRATAVNSADWRLRKADPFAIRFFFGLTKPKFPILGGVLSGEIEAVGKNVTRFKTGDAVFGSVAFDGLGAYAEYACVPEKAVLALKPENLTHREAAVIPFGGMTALHFIRKANIQPGQKVLINGASGAVGSAAVQLAKHFGATVTAICSTTNLELVKSIGADKAIDYTKENFNLNGELYDVIFDTVNKLPVGRSAKSLKPGGILILSDAGIGEMLQGLWASLSGKRKLLAGIAKERSEDVDFLKQLVEKGEMKPVIDRTYPLDELAFAHAYAEKGHKKGNVAIEI